MIRRLINISKDNSLLLFGARGAGKTTLLKQLFEGKSTLWIDLLTDADEERFGRDPDELSKALEKQAGKITRVVIDEIQKKPKLLDIVQIEIEKNPKIQFILTGSSARKLKRGSANLLGGRAFMYHLFPFTSVELGEHFDLKQALKFGTIPKIFTYKNDEEKMEYLRGYIRTYLKEEIQVEQVVRDLDPFRDFLEVAAQMNGKIINFSKLARDVGVEDKTIKSYYQILEDTLIGFFLPPFHRSIRKRQREAPKFYFFDNGVQRALERTLTLDLLPKTYSFGNAFEHFLMTEVYRLCEYNKKDFRISYLKTKDQAEIDLIIERPGNTELLVEIKSTDRVTADDYKSLLALARDWDRPCEAQVWSQDPLEKKDGIVTCLPWSIGIKQLLPTS